MGYDFDRIIERRHTNNVKWDVGPGELPMWVADMDFPSAPAVVEAVKARAEYGVWGYAGVPDQWYDAYVGWWRDRHGLAMEKDWLLFCTAIVPAVGSVVRRLTAPGEKVTVLAPVYNAFYHCVTDNGRVISESRLRYEAGVYTVDFDDLEQKLADPACTLFILCNPHNPTGNIWDRETLERIGQLCGKYAVPVLADEIHCDLTDPGVEYVPFASVSPQCRDMAVTCIAPTKAFNLAGVKTAAMAVADPALRAKLSRALHNDGIAEASAFAIDAAVAAFTQGGEWLDALRAYIADNKRTVAAYLEKELPQVKAVPSQATYLVWLDCTALPGDKRELAQFIRAETGLYLNAGAAYGSGGESFLRMNLGCPRAYVDEGLARLKAGVQAWERTH